MLDTPEQIAATLEGTALAGSPVRAHPSGLVLIDVSDPEQVLGAWQAARAVLPITGRWPVMIEPGSDFSFEFEQFPPPGAADLDRLDATARTVDPWPGIESWLEDRPVTAEELADALEEAAVPEGMHARATAELTPPTTSLTIERWIFDQLATDPGLAAQVEESTDVPYLVGTQQWFTPNKLQVALLPTASPWLAPAWLDFFETEPENLAAILYQWHSGYAAELVAFWGTMLQFVVARPPEPGAQAWELASQQLSLGPSLQSPLWMLARALPRSDAWFIHSRP